MTIAYIQQAETCIMTMVIDVLKVQEKLGVFQSLALISVMFIMTNMYVF